MTCEPFLLDDELKEKAIKWVEWANKADPKEYDPFYKEEIKRTEITTTTPSRGGYSPGRKDKHDDNSRMLRT